jgi:glutamate synthase domain-containing protein 3
MVRPFKDAMFDGFKQVLVGNTVLYGATSGALYVAGYAGERFAVRNSGALAVVEGTGDHACEYMTGGVAVILGGTGRNFGAGMSGGLAFVFDEDGLFNLRCNLSLIELERLQVHDHCPDAEFLRKIITRHLHLTGSVKAQAILANWPASVSQFIRVIPKDLKEALGAKKRLLVQDASRIAEREAAAYA